MHIMDDMLDCPSPNWNERSHPITAVVLHYTGMPDAAGAIAWLTNPQSGVSSHYVVAEDGQVVRLVPEEKRAWHAGVSSWRGDADLNSRSVGIEIVNPGHEWGYRPFPEPQLEALTPLLADLVKRYGIQPRNVVGHADIAPTRKQDPGELFPWDRFARLGLAVPTPARATADPNWTDPGFLLALNRWGYDVTDGPAAVTAFQRRFRPARVDGVIDGQCRAILLALLLGDEQRSAMRA